MTRSTPAGQGDVCVTVVGSLNVDRLIASTRIPRPGETVIGGPVRQQFGGKGANQAIAARMLGAHVRLIGCLGADADGESYRRYLAEVGVDDRGVATSEVKTGRAYVLLAPEGENCIVVDPGANATMTAALVEDAEPIIGSADVVVVSLEIPLDAVRTAIEIAHLHGRPVVLNPAPAYTDAAYHLLGAHDVITPNQHEAKTLSGATPIPLSDHTNIVVTRGSQGAALIRRGCTSTELLPAPRVTAVDTTGAGDAFTAALAWGMAHGAAFRACVDIAIATSAHAVTVAGAQLGTLPAELIKSTRKALRLT